MVAATRVHPKRTGAGLLRAEDGHRTLGRPSRLALGFALAVAWAALSAGGAAADASPSVVTWTVYPASGGSVSSGSVSLSTLDTCPLYSGSSPMHLYDPPYASTPYSPSSTSAWSLSSVVTCGLAVPVGDVTNVQIDSPAHGFETPLTGAQLSDPSRWHDPAAPGALPVISVDGAQEDQNDYVRPWLGGSDDNAVDHVVVDGAPIAIVVYENGLPLTVDATAQTVSETGTSMTAEFSATVHNPDGTTVPSAELGWGWSYGDGGTSTAPTPEHSFVVQGVYAVTVQVTDNATGQGGTATIPVSFSTSSGTGPGGL
jgi:PKD domain